MDPPGIKPQAAEANSAAKVGVQCRREDFSRKDAFKAYIYRASLAMLRVLRNRMARGA
jgi:hypothetical protein